MSYRAFISYSHEADAELASAVQSALHNFARPWYRIRALHVFRDKTSLAANPALAASLEKAMGNCDYLLLVASPQAARSAWVRQEIDWWLKDHSVENILILLASGDIVWDPEEGDFNWDRTTSLPTNLKGQFAEEPLHVNLRWIEPKHREHLSLRDPQFREAILNIAAPLHGKSKEELDGEDLRQFRRTKWTVTAGAIILITAAAVAWQRGNEAAQQRRIATSREIAAEADRQLKVDPERSLLLALEATKRAQTREAEVALRRALTESRLRASIGDSQRSISAAIFSPDGKLLVTRDREWKVQGWSAPNWKERAALPKSVGRISWISFSHDGRYLLTAGPDGNPRMWDTATWKEVLEFKGHAGSVHSAEFSPDGELVATAGADHTVRLWDTRSGTNIATLKGHTDTVLGALFSPDSNRLITLADSNSDEHPTRLWDVRTHKVIAFLDGEIVDFEKPVFTRASIFSPDGHLVATAHGQTIWVWNAETGRVFDTLTLKSQGRVWGVSFSPTGHSLAVADFDGVARVWRVGTTNALTELRGHTGPVWSAIFSPDGNSVLTSSEDSTARRWDVASGTNSDTFLGRTPLRTAEFSSDGRYVVTLGNHTPASVIETSSPGVTRLHHNSQVNAAAFSSDAKLIATSSFDRTITVWDARTHKPLHVFANLPGFALSVAISSDAHLVAAGCSDGSVRVFDLQTGSERPVFSKFRSNVRTVAFSADSRLLMAASMDGIATIWEVGTGLPVAQIDDRETPFELSYEVAFDPSGKSLARAGRSGAVRILEVPSGRVKATLTGHSKQIQRMTFSHDGQFLVTASEDQTARVWKVDTGRMITELRGHSGRVNGADFNVDASLVVTAGEDRVVRVWNATDGQTVAQLPDATAQLWAATFSPDGKSILSASGDGFVRLYSREMFAPLEELLDLAQGRAIGKLTADEIQALPQ